MATPNPQDQQVASIPIQEVAAAALVALYAQANATLLAGFFRIVRLAPVTLAGPSLIHTRASRHAEQVVAHLENEAPGWISQMMQAAEKNALHHADTAAGRAGGHAAGFTVPTADEPWLTHAQASVRAIQVDLEGKMAEVHQHILRTPDDLYKSIVAAATSRQVGNHGITPQQAQAEAFADFVDRGITGYTRRDGARLPIESYTEMAVRTAAMRAYNESYMTRLAAHGITYFTVPNDGHPCPACWPWQGRVLTTGMPDAIAEFTVTQAEAGGLFHPQCKHVLSPFLPGHRVPTPSPAWTPEQAAQYAATQRLRALERRVRQQKDVRDHAVTPEVKQHASRMVRQTEAAIREHVETHDLNRRRRREQPHLGLAPKTT